MGGRGGKGGSWKSQLAKMARNGRVPEWIMGRPELQAQVFEQIDRLYKMPETTAKITDQGNSVYVNFGSSVQRASYPSGANAGEKEKRGVLKWILYSRRKK